MRVFPHRSLEESLADAQQKFAQSRQRVFAPELPAPVPAKKKRRKKKRKSQRKLLPMPQLPKPQVEATEKDRKRRYTETVHRYTRAHDLSHIPNIEKRAFRRWDLDHIISVSEGFKRGIPPKVIAHPDNLRICTHVENHRKGADSFWHLHPQGAELQAQYPLPN